MFTITSGKTNHGCLKPRRGSIDIVVIAPHVGGNGANQMWLLGLISILLLIGLPILAIVAFLRTSKLIDQQSRLEKLVTARIQAIEDQLAELAESGVAPATVITEKNPGDSVSEEPADSATIAEVAQENDPDDAPTDDEPDEEAVAETPLSQEEPEELPAAARSSPWAGKAKT